ncbi:heavy metal-binding domain-containing protein [Enterovibrio norvegicus]
MVMILTTTPLVEGKSITEYLGVVVGYAILCKNLFKGIFASVRDIVGAR